MTPTERAEKLAVMVCDLLNVRPTSRQDADNFDAVVKEIAAQIAEAEREAEEHGKKEAHRTMQGLQTVLQRTTDLVDGFDDGFTTARDQAAGIAEQIEAAYHKEFPNTLYPASANRIRAMEPKMSLVEESKKLEAEREAIKHHHFTEKCCDACFDWGKEKGFMSARDQAAKIAGEHSVIHRDYVDDELIVCILSESIRAMEPMK